MENLKSENASLKSKQFEAAKNNVHDQRKWGQHSNENWKYRNRNFYQNNRFQENNQRRGPYNRNRTNQQNFRHTTTQKVCHFCNRKNPVMSDCFKFKNVIQQQINQNESSTSQNFDPRASTFRSQSHLN